jgi:diadenosine tetraphosphate (Ap4A) HIT family hydrolase
MVKIGDAILKVTDSYRINYEILGNSEPELHAHILPRYMSEAEDKRRMPAWFYDWTNAVRYSSQEHGHILQAIRAQLQTEA